MNSPTATSTTGNSGVVQELARGEVLAESQAPEVMLGKSQEIVTRSKQRAKEQLKQSRFVLIAAGSIVAALLVFVATSVPRRNTGQKPKTIAAANAVAATPGDGATPDDKSLFPITDSGQPAAKATHGGFLNEQDMQRTAVRRPRIPDRRDAQASVAGSLGSIPPFGEANWQAPPYQAGTSTSDMADASDLGKAEREAMEKSSLVYVCSASATRSDVRDHVTAGNLDPDTSLGLATGTRLRARLESAASTAVRTPVLAVIEYNYERDGEIIVPAGAKAVGHLQEADRSGYVRVQFDSLLMPDGATVPIQAAATDLEMRPLKGKVEGKNMGKNVLVRSLTGIGQMGAMLVGRPSLNQPLNESDLIRERVGNNIGEAGDEQVSKLTVTEHIVVAISAGTPIYVVLEQTPRTAAVSSATNGAQLGNSTNAEELRQLLQLQRELNQEKASNQ